jgi:hypothetical protein
MHEGDKTECRFTDGTARDRQTGLVSERHTPDRCKLHEEIVRMLAVDEGAAVERLADLEQLGVAASAFCRSIETQHRLQGDARRSNPMRRLSHPPVGRLELGIASRSALVIEHTEQHAVLHEVPCRRVHVHVRVVCRRLLVLSGGSIGRDQERDEHTYSAGDTPCDPLHFTSSK